MMNVRLSWSGLWLLIMLLYTDVVNTSVSILNCPIQKNKNRELVSVRTYCNEIKCIDNAEKILIVHLQKN